MLDELLGRAELKERIAELEERTERLDAQLAAESERRADAVSARQEAEEELNRLEDRIAQLEGELARVEDDGDDLSFRDRTSLRGDRLDEVLARLESVATEPEGLLSAAVGAGEDAPDSVVDVLGDRARLVERAAPCLVYADDVGLLAAVLEPPVQPDPFRSWGDGVVLDRSWFRPTGRYALALVRADVFAIGEYEGRERLSLRSVESDVKSDHSKGGFSQGRFERVRDEQIRDHLDDCREAIAEREVDRLFVVGDRRLVGEFDDVAEATAAVDATGDPRAALTDAERAFFTTRLSTF